jgi:hypothetical protein
MDAKNDRDLTFSTLSIMGAGAGMLVLGTACLLTMRSIGGQYVREVGGVSRASTASRVTTTWPDGDQSHSLQTTREDGETVQAWALIHKSERDEMRSIFGGNR